MKVDATDQLDDDFRHKPLNRECDVYDYIAASACGAISGIIDIFLVGSPVNEASLALADELEVA